MGRTDQGVPKPTGRYEGDRLEAIPEEALSNPVVPVKQELLMPEQTNRNIMDSGLEIRLGDCILHVTETTSASLLSKVIGVIRDAQ